ncbi:MAG: hypothetical protein JWP69_1788 [Flaviaesturariibacter sp.]|nr:hypothetical protein [Flaviaesturariibacter sp.]
MENVTYLLGAGASCESLPTYANFKARFNSFMQFFRGVFTNNTSIDAIERQKIQTVITDFESLESELSFHNTPDTIAKKYFHTGADTKLFSLKCSLTLFFHYEQNSNTPHTFLSEEPERDLIDKRYDAFIASLLKPVKGKLELLEHVNILSWNYDLQFELAYSRYSTDNLIHIQEVIQSFPRVFSQSRPLSKEKFSLIHLNGIAFPILGGNDLIIGSQRRRDKEYCLYLCGLHQQLKSTNQSRQDNMSLISFAWENLEHNYELKENDIIEKAIESVEKTKILIINGYSFPIFNRAIDLKILQAMSSIKKVYIQNPNAKDLMPLLTDIFKQRISADEIQDVGYYNQFFIPDWLMMTSPQYSVT